MYFQNHEVDKLMCLQLLLELKTLNQWTKDSKKHTQKNKIDKNPFE